MLTSLEDMLGQPVIGGRQEQLLMVHVKTFPFNSWPGKRDLLYDAIK
jgi:hypothetical protein